MELKVFKMNDCEWWADVSMEMAVVNYCKECNLDSDECIDNPRELTDEDLEANKFYTGELHGPEFISFKEELVKFDEPAFFASTEY